MDGWCRPILETDTLDTESSTEPLPSGLGEPCLENDDCDGFDADYCAIDIRTNTGVCTIQGCSTSPDDCPAGLLCCDLPNFVSYPNVCTSPQGYADLVELLGSCTGDVS